MLAVGIAALPFAAVRPRACRRLRQVDAVVGRSGASDRLKSAAIAVVLAAAGAALFARADAALPARAGGSPARAPSCASRCCSCGSRRSCSTRCSTTTATCRPGARAPTSSSSRAAAGVDVGEVLVVDASRRTTAANAYVDGLGHTKRVVLYDTLLERFTPDQVRLVVAHELGHVKHRDLRARDAVGGDRRARRDVRRDAAHPALERARRDACPARRPRCRRSRWRWRSSRSRRRSSRTSSRARSRPTRTPTRSS